MLKFRKLSVILLSGSILILILLAQCNEQECSCFTYGGIDSEITNNHGHKLVIPKEHFTNPVDGTYSIKGTADHDHTVFFTGENLGIVSGNNSNTVTSSPGGTNNHTHEVTLDCSCF